MNLKEYLCISSIKQVTVCSMYKQNFPRFSPIRRILTFFFQRITKLIYLEQYPGKMYLEIREKAHFSNTTNVVVTILSLKYSNVDLCTYIMEEIE